MNWPVFGWSLLFVVALLAFQVWAAPRWWYPFYYIGKAWSFAPTWVKRSIENGLIGAGILLSAFLVMKCWEMK